MVEKYIIQNEEEEKELFLLEKIFFEFQAKTSILKIAMEQNIDKIDNNAYKFCIEQYTDSFIAYEKQKHIFEEKVIIPITNNKPCNWSVISFLKQEINIQYVDE